MKTSTRKARDIVSIAAMDDTNIPARPGAALDDQIAQRAYELYCARGCRHGNDLDDWLQAERDVRGDQSAAAAAEASSSSLKHAS